MNVGFDLPTSKILAFGFRLTRWRRSGSGELRYFVCARDSMVAEISAAADYSGDQKRYSVFISRRGAPHPVLGYLTSPNEETVVEFARERMGVSEKNRTYDGLTRAALEIAYDSGAFFCGRTEETLKARLAGWCGIQKSFSAAHLRAIDAWLAALPSDALNTVCCGEHDDMHAALKGAPAQTSELLNDLFEEVC